MKLFRELDTNFAHLKAFSTYDDSILNEYGFSEEQYEDMAALYKNILASIPKSDPTGEPSSDSEEEPVIDDYELVAYSKSTINFEYIVNLLQGIVESIEDTDEDSAEEGFTKKIKNLREVILDFSGKNSKLGRILSDVLDDIEKDRENYINKDIAVIINQMRHSAVDKEIKAFSEKWFVGFENVKYEVYHFKDGELANENKLKENADYGAYKESVENPLAKFRFNRELIKDFKENLMREVEELL